MKIKKLITRHAAGTDGSYSWKVFVFLNRKALFCDFQLVSTGKFWTEETAKFNMEKAIASLRPTDDKRKRGNRWDPHLEDWGRSQWAVEMKSETCRPEGILIGVAWHKTIPATYDGEPPRPLLFTTREKARRWCAAKSKECARHSPDWKFRPVKVRESIEPCVSEGEKRS